MQASIPAAVMHADLLQRLKLNVEPTFESC